MQERVSDRGDRHLPEPDAPAARPPRARRREDDARDYARLLVSDVRLYHEVEVVLGRAAKDLSRRLEGPIAQARARYLRRHGEQEIFVEELVRILAGGDASRLG